RSSMEMAQEIRDTGLSDRKLHLFACGCLRRVLDWLPMGSIREAIDVTERFADGRANLEQLKAVWWEACEDSGEEFWWWLWDFDTATPMALLEHRLPSK